MEQSLGRNELEDIMLCEIRQSQKEKYVMILLQEEPRVVKFVGTEVGYGSCFTEF